MAKVIRCDECAKDIGEYDLYVEVTPVNTPTTFADRYLPKQFCNESCLVNFLLSEKGVKK